MKIQNTPIDVISKYGEEIYSKLLLMNSTINYSDPSAPDSALRCNTPRRHAPCKVVVDASTDTSPYIGPLPSFRKITPASMDEIWPFLLMEKGRTTDFSYGGLLMWVETFGYEYAVFNQTLFIKGVVEDNRSMPAFSLPIGRMPIAESVRMLRTYCRMAGITLEFSAVPEYALEEFREAGAIRTELLSDWSDYLYPAEQLATLKGKKMSKKRNHVNQFISLNPGWSVAPLTPDILHETMDFMATYDSQLDNAPMGHEESRLAREAIRLCASGKTRYIGMVLRDGNGRICALSVGDIKNDTLYVHIEKADRNVAGSYEMINREFAASVCSGHPEIRFINREDDSGDLGLRLAKESYHPCEMLRKYNVCF